MTNMIPQHPYLTMYLLSQLPFYVRWKGTTTYQPGSIKTWDLEELAACRKTSFWYNDWMKFSGNCIGFSK